MGKGWERESQKFQGIPGISAHTGTEVNTAARGARAVQAQSVPRSAWGGVATALGGHRATPLVPGGGAEGAGDFCPHLPLLLQPGGLL